MSKLLKEAPAVGDGVTIQLHSDLQAFTVVAAALNALIRKGK